MTTTHLSGTMFSVFIAILLNSVVIDTSCQASEAGLKEKSQVMENINSAINGCINNTNNSWLYNPNSLGQQIIYDMHVPHDQVITAYCYRINFGLARRDISKSDFDTIRRDKRFTRAFLNVLKKRAPGEPTTALPPREW